MSFNQWREEKNSVVNIFIPGVEFKYENYKQIVDRGKSMCLNPHI